MSHSFERDSFESRLTGLFDQPPAFDDNAAFAETVARRFERKARLRICLTWGAAAIGAAFAGVGLVQGADVDLSQALASAADLYGPTTLWLGVGIAVTAWAALPMLGGSEA